MARPRDRRSEPDPDRTEAPRGHAGFASPPGRPAALTPPAAAPESEEPPFTLPEGEPMGIEDIRDALVIRERSVFLLTDPTGNVPSGNRQGFGVYSSDTRHLSAYSFNLNGVMPVILLSTAELGYAMEQVMTNPRLATPEGRTAPRGTIEFRRQRVVADGIEERLRVTNFNPFPVTLNILYQFAADFADIFDVRGYERERMGAVRDPVVRERSVHFSYTGV
ncbi:MAG: hypothetical protein EPO22_13770, partial [Dehalococcoidia bacterium]